MTPIHCAVVYSAVGAFFSLAMYSIVGHHEPMSPVDHALAAFRITLLWPYYMGRVVLRGARRLGGSSR